MVIHDFESERRVPVAADLKAIRTAFRDGGVLLARAGVRGVFARSARASVREVLGR